MSIVHWCINYWLTTVKFSSSPLQAISREKFFPVPGPAYQSLHLWNSKKSLDSCSNLSQQALALLWFMEQLTFVWESLCSEQRVVCAPCCHITLPDCWIPRKHTACSTISMNYNPCFAITHFFKNLKQSTKPWCWFLIYCLTGMGAARLDLYCDEPYLFCGYHFQLSENYEILMENSFIYGL